MPQTWRCLRSLNASCFAIQFVSTYDQPYSQNVLFCQKNDTKDSINMFIHPQIPSDNCAISRTIQSEIVFKLRGYQGTNLYIGMFGYSSTSSLLMVNKIVRVEKERISDKLIKIGERAFQVLHQMKMSSGYKTEELVQVNFLYVKKILALSMWAAKHLDSFHIRSILCFAVFISIIHTYTNLQSD